MKTSQKGTKLNDARYFQQPRPYTRKRITRMRLIPDLPGTHGNVISLPKNQILLSTYSRSSEKSRDRCITLDRNQRSREIICISYTSDSEDSEIFCTTNNNFPNRWHDTFVEIDSEKEIFVCLPEYPDLAPNVIENVKLGKNFETEKEVQVELKLQLEEKNVGVEEIFKESKYAFPVKSELREEPIPVKTELRKEPNFVKSELREEPIPVKTELREEPISVKSKLREEAIPVKSELQEEPNPVKLKIRKKPRKLKLQEEPIPVKVNLRKEAISAKLEVREERVPVKLKIHKEPSVPVKLKVHESPVFVKLEVRKEQKEMERKFRHEKPHLRSNQNSFESERSFWLRYGGIRKILDFFGHLLGKRANDNHDKEPTRTFERRQLVEKRINNPSNEIKSKKGDISMKNRSARSTKRKNIQTRKNTTVKQPEERVFSGLTRQIMNTRDKKLRATLMEYEMRARKLEEENRHYRKILKHKLKKRQTSSPLC